MRLNVAVILGGRSVEHEISIISGLQCAHAIDQSKYRVILIYISKQGDWYSGDALWEMANYRDLDHLLASCRKVIVNQNAGAAKLYLEPRFFWERRSTISVDIIFPVMHGTYGEDGSLQGWLEMAQLPYVGCNVLASAIAMDKVTTKMVLQALNIPVLDYLWFYGERWIQDRAGLIQEIEAKFGYPVIVKPGNLGSSIGVTAVANQLELGDAIDLGVRLSRKVIIEPLLTELKEVNCAVLGDRNEAIASICEEPIRSKTILSYADKYQRGGKGGELGAKAGGSKVEGMGGAQRKIPAEISSAQTLELQELAKRAFIGLNCCGVARIDFLIDQRSGQPYLCELNTIPGSLAFYLWEHSGVNFTALTDRLLTLALKRCREESNLILSYADNLLQTW